MLDKTKRKIIENISEFEFGKGTYESKLHLLDEIVDLVMQDDLLIGDLFWNKYLNDMKDVGLINKRVNNKKVIEKIADCDWLWSIIDDAICNELSKKGK